VRAVSADDVLSAAKAHLQSDALQLVIVGDPDVVVAPLEALRLGPVAVYDSLGRPLST
jgi:predicted Zn-dependent peptidase